MQQSISAVPVSQRWALAGSALVALGLTLAACGSRPAPGTVPEKPQANAGPEARASAPEQSAEPGPPPAVPPAVPVPDTPQLAGPSRPVARLRETIDRLLAQPTLARASWAVEVRSLDRQDTLYAWNARKLMMPASNMKVVTVAVAAERLGWDYRFETTLLAAGPVVNGTLQGDLVVRGTGDPTIGSEAEDSSTTFETWAELLQSVGIRRIDGRILGDDNVFDDEGIGAGWAWDYLAEGYAAPVGALAYKSDATTLSVAPGPRLGGPVSAAIESDAAGLTLVNHATTGLDSESDTLTLRRVPGSSDLRLDGRIPQSSKTRLMMISVDNPTEYFVRALRSVLVKKGIAVTGAALDMDALPSPIDSKTLTPLVVHDSPPLADIATVVMKISHNMYADTLFKTMGGGTGTATADEGRKVAAEVLRDWGIEAESYVMYDGSGLSRYNYVCADLLVRILRRMHGDPRHAGAFIRTLPVGAVDGSLARRYVNRPAAGRVRAKTGSISNVRSLSGYVDAAGGETLAFAILANHFTAPQSEIDAVIDDVVDVLAVFRRE